MSASGADVIDPTRGEVAAKPAAEGHKLWPSIIGLIDGLADRCGGLVRIIALESQLAALSLAYMILLAVLGGMLIVSTWVLFNLTLALWLSDNGWLPVKIIFLMSLFNLAAAVAAVLLLRKFSGNLLFTGSRTE
ncbi:MAG TPA: hypothetical protein VGL10_09555, partial [Gammaproteobacteria bacterium]